MEREHVVARRLEVLHVEGRIGRVPQVLAERGGDELPLQLAVGERFSGLQAAVVRAEQRPEIPTCHVQPPIR
ncbi:hypothetical protein [Streptomyces thermolilacinus]|uniref:hypothetical protein n=1 Tax=Streptomyces thermolilacinus TaxID=285540 RepID=UPI0033DBB2FA